MSAAAPHDWQADGPGRWRAPPPGRGRAQVRCCRPDGWLVRLWPAGRPDKVVFYTIATSRRRAHALAAQVLAALELGGPPACGECGGRLGADRALLHVDGIRDAEIAAEPIRGWICLDCLEGDLTELEELFGAGDGPDAPEEPT